MKQPHAILPIFFTESWERFGYYSIQGILVLYLIGVLHYTESAAFSTLGEVLSWIYVAPVLGGLIADRVLGYRYCILVGGILLCIGYGLLAYSAYLFLHLSLAFIIVGNGLLKPNASSFLGLFYYHDDPRRYPGFTFYFTGINIGGLAAIIISNLASRFFGYSGIFIITAIGMLIAISVFIYGFRYFENRGLPINLKQSSSPWIRALDNKFIWILILLLAIQSIHLLLNHAHISTFLLISMAIAVVVSLFYIQYTTNRITHNKLIAIIILISTSIIFWAENLQVFFTLILYTSRYVDRSFFHFQIPATLFIILEPAFLLILGPLVAKLWEKLSERRKEPGPVLKFSLGLLNTSLAMGLLALITYTTSSQQLISPIWLLIFYAMITTSTILISPTGMAMITELAPTKLTGFIMGVWYMVIGLGSLLASLLAKLSLNVTSATEFHPSLVYGHAFIVYAIIAAFTGSFLLLIAPQLNKLIHSHL